MWPPVRNFEPWQALPRLLADFINVHLCMIGALATPVLYLALRHQNDSATTRLTEAMAYYSWSFMLLSLLFPLVFLLNGFYTHSRGYIGRYKKLVILRGVGISMLLFLAANFILFRRTLVPRSVLLVFSGLAMMSLARFGRRIAREIHLQNVWSSFSVEPDTLVRSWCESSWRPVERFVFWIASSMVTPPSAISFATLTSN